MTSPILPLRPELSAVQPYGAPQLEVPVCLNVNENPYSPSIEMVTAIKEAVVQAATGLNRYPDRDFPALRQKLAEYLLAESGVHLDKEQIWAGNGSNEVMMHLLSAYAGPGRTVLSTEYSYSMYPEYARNANSRFVEMPRRDDFQIDLSALLAGLVEYQPAVVLLANPNNPTGTAMTADEIKQILDQAATTGPEEGTASLVVIDEAYGEFRREGMPSALEFLADYPHLVVTRTLSKSFGMAGLRLGYFAASKEVVYDMLRVRLPYHLSAVTQAAAQAALSFGQNQAQQLAKLRQRRDDLVQWLRGFGFTVPDSDGNFVLFGPLSDDQQVFADLLAEGVLIRNVGPRGFLRATIGTAQEDARLRSALVKVLNLNDIPKSEKPSE